MWRVILGEGVGSGTGGGCGESQGLVLGLRAVYMLGHQDSHPHRATQDQGWKEIRAFQ